MIPRRMLLLAAVVLLLAAACAGRPGADDPLQSAIEGTPSPTVAGPTEAPAESSVAAPTEVASTTEPPLVTRTDTAWGRIWDALPAGFPVYPGAIDSLEACSDLQFEQQRVVLGVIDDEYGN